MVTNCISQTSKILGTAGVTSFLLYYAKILKALITTIVSKIKEYFNTHIGKMERI